MGGVEFKGDELVVIDVVFQISKNHQNKPIRVLDGATLALGLSVCYFGLFLREVSVGRELQEFFNRVCVNQQTRNQERNKAADYFLAALGWEGLRR